MIQKLKLKIFNDYSSYGYGFFIDKKGRKIWYFEDENSLFKLILFHRGNTIGYMKYIFYEDHIELGDIFIFDDFPQFRNSCIGSWMFCKLKEIAKEHGFKKIIGNMQAEKKEFWPKLIIFYKSHGCEIVDGWFILRM